MRFKKRINGSVPSGRTDSNPNTIATPGSEINENNQSVLDPITNIPISNSEKKTEPTAIENSKDLPMLHIASNKVVGTDERPHVMVTVGEREFTMLLDSGAQITLVGINWIRKLKEDWKDHLQSPQFNITMVDDKTKYTPLGVVDITYSYMGMTRLIPTLVLSIETRHPILGATFFEAFNIDFVQRTADGWTSIPTFSLEGNTTAHANVTNIESSTRRPPITASQFIGWMNYDEALDRKKDDAKKEVCPVDTSKDNEPTSTLEFDVKMREEDQDDDVTPPKTACVNTPHHLSPQQQKMLRSVLELFKHTAAIGKLNQTSKIEHVIDTGTAVPVMKKQYPFSPYVVEKVQKELDKMVERDIIMTIEYSPWRAPVLAVDKKDGGCRVCLDARELNRVTVPNAYPITDVNYILSRIRTARYLSSIDLSQAFFQIPLEKSSQYKTAFAFGNRLYCFKRMTMSLRNSPATLAILIDTIFRDLSPYAFAYVDDFIICTETFEQHMKILTIIAKRLADAGLTISPSKSNFCFKRLEFLGYILSEEGLSTNPDKVSAIHKFPCPTTAKEARRLIGAAGWYRKFIPNFAEITAPISDLYKGNKKGKIDWTDEAEKAFITLKEKLTTTPVLAMPDYNLPFKIYWCCNFDTRIPGRRKGNSILFKEIFEASNELLRKRARVFSRIAGC